MKTSDLIGPALDWAVAQCEGYKDLNPLTVDCQRRLRTHNYSANWAKAGPIIEREGIELMCNLTASEAARFNNAHADWQAFYRQRRATHERSLGTTPLIAAMRCYVAAKLGDDVEIPKELI